ncbi:hypothetical protein P8C59_003687 [Phyllachora maydis]|uniref:Uncharacterized protein n=1 Tax=Phyllachora maydis TaxID=1825666 RepID=A0AAD9I220_9PEZI|nr:hypothetical protein P8C59_003687 [Phyllachora maydis]
MVNRPTEFRNIVVKPYYWEPAQDEQAGQTGAKRPERTTESSELSPDDKLAVAAAGVATDSTGALVAASSALRRTRVAANAAFFAASNDIYMYD